MMFTEEEARTKWCPFARQNSDTHSYNRGGHIGGGLIRCLASDCMAWRWRRTGTAVRNVLTGEAHVLPAGQDDTGANLAVEGRVYSGTHGYCGLAGVSYDTD